MNFVITPKSFRKPCDPWSRNVPTTAPRVFRSVIARILQGCCNLYPIVYSCVSGGELEGSLIVGPCDFFRWSFAIVWQINLWTMKEENINRIARLIWQFLLRRLWNSVQYVLLVVSYLIILWFPQKKYTLSELLISNDTFGISSCSRMKAFYPIY